MGLIFAAASLVGLVAMNSYFLIGPDAWTAHVADQAGRPERQVAMFEQAPVIVISRLELEGKPGSPERHGLAVVSEATIADHQARRELLTALYLGLAKGTEAHPRACCTRKICLSVPDRQLELDLDLGSLSFELIDGENAARGDFSKDLVDYLWTYVAEDVTR